MKRDARFGVSRLRSLWILGVVFYWLEFSVAVAQLPTATILGVVKDSTGAVIPGTALTVRSEETGQVRTAVSAADGTFRFPALPVGSYEVRIEQTGFQSQVRSGLALSVGQEAVMNFTLEVGTVEQTVEVTAEAPLVNTTSGSLGGLVNEEEIAELPLNGRNYINLTLMQNGISQHKNINYVAGMSGVWFSSNGAPLRSNNYLLDGAPMQDVYGAASASVSNSTLGVDGIREYRVVTNSFSAEYGMTMGSQMTIVSKNGTNELHGSVFEYLRNDVLDARNFFDYKTIADPRRLPAFRKNQFGGSVGGPIQRDKMHFHAVYEALRERLGRTIIGNAMPPTCTVEGAICPVAIGAATSFVTPAIAPVVRPLLQFFPAPNLPAATAGGLPRYTFPFSQPTREDYGQARVDRNFSSNSTFFGRYTVDDTERTEPLLNPNFKLVLTNRNQFSTLSENHIISPTLLNTSRFSYSRTRTLSLSPSSIIGPQFSFVPGKEIGGVTPGSGISGYGPDGPSPVHLKQNVFTWSDDVFYTRGEHSFKLGALINRYQQYMLVSTGDEGSVSFPNLRQFLTADTPTSISAVTEGSILDRTYHYTTLGFYVQDDWRWNEKLTFNLGLRYEFLTQPREVRGHGAAIRDITRDTETTLGPPFLNPSLRNFSPRFGFAWDPRGTGQTAVRGGFGLLYDIGNLGSALVVGTTATPPFSRRSQVDRPATFTVPFQFPPEAAGRQLRTVDYHIQQPHMMQYNLTVERQLPASMALTLAYGGSRGINIVQTVEGNPVLPYGVVNGLDCDGDVLTATVSASLFTGPVCFLSPPATSTNLTRTNRAWGPVEFKTAGGNSVYNSLQVALRKRMSGGLQVQSSYTWSKAIDDTQSQLGAENNASGSTAAWNTRPSIDRALASYDLAHNWRFSAIYRPPNLWASGGAPGVLLNGWWFSGILSMQTGYPFSPSIASDRARKLSGDNRPDLRSGRSNSDITSGTTAGCLGMAAGQRLGGPERYYDPCAFAVQSAGFLGSSGRNILRGPGFATVDFSIAKDTALGLLGEAGKLEFRAEIFNLLNRANFGTPNRTIFSATPTANAATESVLPAAGQISTITGTSRQIQLSLRVAF